MYNFGILTAILSRRSFWTKAKTPFPMRSTRGNASDLLIRGLCLDAWDVEKTYRTYVQNHPMRAKKKPYRHLRR